MKKYNEEAWSKSKNDHEARNFINERMRSNQQKRKYGLETEFSTDPKLLVNYDVKVKNLQEKVYK